MTRITLSSLLIGFTLVAAACGAATGIDDDRDEFTSVVDEAAAGASGAATGSSAGAGGVPEKPTNGAGGAAGQGAATSAGGASTGTAGAATSTGGASTGTAGASTGAGGGPVDPFSLPPTCSSGKTWTSGNKGSKNMNPGQACLTCHAKDFEAPDFAIAGTVYATGHEPNNCNGQASTSSEVEGAVVVVTDATGKEFAMKVETSSGNFFSKVPVAAVKFPIGARVEYAGKVRAMKGAVPTGDCNSCHTQDGSQGAPGRVVLP